MCTPAPLRNRNCTPCAYLGTGACGAWRPGIIIFRILCNIPAKMRFYRGHRDIVFSEPYDLVCVQMSVCCLLPEGIEAFREQYFSKYKIFTLSFSNFRCGIYAHTPCVYGESARGHSHLICTFYMYTPPLGGGATVLLAAPHTCAVQLNYEQRKHEQNNHRPRRP